MKTFFLDIDGVIYKDGKINNKVIEIIKKSHNKYIFCTGRGYYRCLDIVGDYIAKSDEIILENGGQIRKKDQIYYNEIPISIKKAMSTIKKEDIEYIIFSTKGTNEYYSYGQKDLLHIRKNYCNYEDFLNLLYTKKTCQITIKFKEKSKQNIFLKTCKIKNIEYKLSEEYVIINNNDVSKRTAIEYLIKNNNLDRNSCIIVGNDYNDIDMFDIDCYKKIGVLDEYTPKEIKEKATELVDFDNLSELISKIV